jgi:hypothetical protein
MSGSGDEAGVRAAEARFYAALRRVHEDGPAALLEAWSRGDDVTTMNAAGGYERGQGEVRGVGPGGPVGVCRCQRPGSSTWRARSARNSPTQWRWSTTARGCCG